MLTLEQEQATNVRDIEHIVETVLDEEMFYDYLKSLNIKSAREIITATPEDIQSATYLDENGVTTAIPLPHVHQILAMSPGTQTFFLLTSMAYFGDILS